MKKNTDRLVFTINHVHPQMGGMGTTTPGGETLKYLYAGRIKIKRKEEFPDGSYIIEGTIMKNAFGYKGKVFYLFIRAGYGIHHGLTALYDCIVLGLAKRSKQGIISMGDQSFGRLSGWVKSPEDKDFTPFYDAIKSLQQVDDLGNGYAQVFEEIEDDQSV
jgi:hypothetical protein